VHARQATSASSTAPIAPRSDAAAVSVCPAASLSPAVLHVTVSCVSASWRQVRARLAAVLRGEESRVIATPGVKSLNNGVVVSRDGSTLLVSDCTGGSHAIHEFRVADGSRLRVIGGPGDGPLQFNRPAQVYVAPDDFVFVADFGNGRVQVLTPRLGFDAIIGVGKLEKPEGVCANDDVIVVSQSRGHPISVFKRGDGALLRRFGSYGSGDGQLNLPRGLCFMTGQRHIAVADCNNHRVSVFSVEGEFVRHVGVGTIQGPQGVACSAFDELVVGDWKAQRVFLFSARGELLKTMGRATFTGVAINGGTIFAHDGDNSKCILFK
jgi:DNA-binding beta-propeller fold protein YncE